MLLDSRKEGGVLVVEMLDQRLDARVASEFTKKMGEFINQGHTQIVIALDKVDFMDSSGLGAIVSSLKIMGRKGDMVISGTRSAVRGLFSLTRMDKVFRIYSTVEEALNALSPVNQ